METESVHTPFLVSRRTNVTVAFLVARTSASAAGPPRPPHILQAKGLEITKNHPTPRREGVQANVPIPVSVSLTGPTALPLSPVTLGIRSLIHHGKFTFSVHRTLMKLLTA